MNVWFESIVKGIEIYRQLAPVCFLPLGICLMVRDGRINPACFLLTQLTGCYLTCVFALVFLPLPTAEMAAHLTYRIQAIPFYCVYDMVRKPSVDAVLGVLFNILMTVPFGMVLRYCFHWEKKQVIAAGLAFTLILEIGQLTGLFFVFRGSYRLCDMDDILQNTFGSYLGYRLICRVEAVIPAVDDLDLPVAAGRREKYI